VRGLLVLDTADTLNAARSNTPARGLRAGAIAVTGLRKTYRLGRVRVPVLRGVDLGVEPGEWVAILGASGSGKSTLLHLVGGLDRPDRGSNDAGPGPKILVGLPGLGAASNPPRTLDLARAAAGELDRYRAECIGFVFQFYHLLPELTVLENVCIGAMVRHGRLGYLRRRPEVHAHAGELLRAFGLGERLRHRPAELSGGERQRVAIARALINRPGILLADEPTGNLDRQTGGQILDVLAGLREQLGLTMLMVTHDAEVAARADRVVRLADGRVADAAAPVGTAAKVV
jgi:lipoprotein-releasing system ATP-binding protein